MSHKAKIYPIDTNAKVEPKIRKKEKPEYFLLVLMLLPIFAGLLAFWAMFNLHLEVSAGVIFKAAMIGIVVGLVSYCINRFAIDWGAELTASGLPIAGVFSVFSILAVGVCLWFFSFAGIVLPDVRVLRLEDHGQALSKYAELQNDKAAQAMRIVPVIMAAGSDLAYHETCEVERGCISGRGGGAGTLSRIVGEKAVRANDISEQLNEGTERLQTHLTKINELLADYRSTLSDTELPLHKRRQSLLNIDAEFGQVIASLNESIPVSLMTAYAEELTTPVTIPNRPGATRAVNGLLAKHGQALKSVLLTLVNEPIERPTFPAKAGLSDTLEYIGNFAALAGIIWVAEGIFPLALWFYTLLFLIRKRELDNAPGDTASPLPSAVQVTSVPDADSPADLDQVAQKSDRVSRNKMNGGRHAK